MSTMTDEIWPTRVARIGLGLPPAKGPHASAPTRCMGCGRPIAQGESAIQWKPSRGTFTDWQYLADNTEIACEDCAVFLENKPLTASQKCVINANGAWSLSKDQHRAWLLTTPPEPPFVAVVSDSMKQHLLWRACVTLDSDYLKVQIGRRNLAIERPRLLEAVETCTSIVEAARAAGIKITPNHPFERLDRDLMDPRHGVIRRDILALGQTDPTLQDSLDQLMTLGDGELWGLAVLAKANIPEPLAEPIQLK